ncbi:hypothetical protein IT41_16575 [Paracoccus halophilus]|uniref:Uncharacterized protein n=1 Tax=Paracoccus halophilus TaxID=376733 RepID=A0A099EXM0_9RHOB|nr:hypothetical protein IT41_16575 [Paracoccus halophilus]
MEIEAADQRRVYFIGLQDGPILARQRKDGFFLTHSQQPDQSKKEMMVGSWVEHRCNGQPFAENFGNQRLYGVFAAGLRIDQFQLCPVVGRVPRTIITVIVVLHHLLSDHTGCF